MTGIIAIGLKSVSCFSFVSIRRLCDFFVSSFLDLETDDANDVMSSFGLITLLDSRVREYIVYPELVYISAK